MHNQQLNLVDEQPELQSTKALLDSMKLADALWWFIENVNDEYQYRNEIFFYLRDRQRRGK